MDSIYSNITFPKKIINKWQKTVDVMTGFLEVTAGLLIRIDENETEVLISGKTKVNPFQQYERSRLINFPFCHEVPKIAFLNPIISPGFAFGNECYF